jgi:hypothetical protein
MMGELAVIVILLVIEFGCAFAEAVQGPIIILPNRSSAALPE